MNIFKIPGTIVFFVCSLFIIIFFESCENELEDSLFFEGETQSISEYIQTREDSFSLFIQLMKAGEIDRTLTAHNPNGNDYTVFLPHNEAFDRFISRNDNYNSFQELLNDVDYIKKLIRYHIVNIAMEKNEFPYGALPDTTLSGDLLIIGFTGSIDSTVVKVNNFAPIIEQDIELSNGYIHVIDEVLDPIVFSSYEWLNQRSAYSVFTRALEITGLADTFKTKDDQFSANTILVESNEVFADKEIYNIDDLKNKYSPDNQDYNERNNGLFQFMAYHILEGKYFLNNFEGKNTNFNTYANFPLSLNATGIDIKINQGVEVFDSIIDGLDTTIIDYIGMDYDQSNVLTENGPIHFIQNVMEVYRPAPRSQEFQFYEEPVINEASQNPDIYIFDNPDEFEVIKWKGVESISYIKSSSGIPGVFNNDYLEAEGDFIITYEIPKILPGRYLLRIRANNENNRNATIQVFLDGKRLGRNFDLTNGNNFTTFDIGKVNFVNYEKHQLKIQTLISGRFSWDQVLFDPD